MSGNLRAEVTMFLWGLTLGVFIAFVIVFAIVGEMFNSAY